jgi:hypothetical protein
VIVKACAGAEDLMAEAVAYARPFRKKRGILGEIKKRMYRDVIDIMDKLDPQVSIEPLGIMIQD